jgi:AraC-like DNA-binding protein
MHENMYFVHLAKKDNAKAILELDAIEQISQEQDIVSLTEVLFLKRQFYSAMGNIALADKYDLLYHKAKDKFLAKSNLVKVDEEKILFKLNEANHEIKELSYKQRIQQTELIAVAIVAVLLMALLLLAWLSHRRTKQKNRSLYEQNQQLLANIDRVRQMRKEQDAPAEKYGRGKMEGDDISQVMEKVERVMDESEEIYSTEFSLDRLAELAGETESRVSQAINTSGHKYYELLNEYRVREACRRLDDKTHSSGLTIEAIGQSVGFKSRSNFVATFKRLTGLTPSAYLKQPSKAKKQPD